MPGRNVINGVLHNFLGTYTSRYSDVGGYWLFGLLVHDLRRVKIDLLHGNTERDVTMLMAARRLAVTKFAQQMQKAGLDMSCLQEAQLEISKSEDPIGIDVNGHPCTGYAMSLVVTAVSDRARVYQRKASMTVAAHNPRVERRSTRVST